jgi:hypothetical protein
MIVPTPLLTREENEGKSEFSDPKQTPLGKVNEFFN